MRCRKMIIIQGYKNGILEGPKQLNFKFKNFNISIDQIGIRIITIIADKICECDKMYSTFCSLERLITLFEGQFLETKQISIYLDNDLETEACKQKAQKIMESRLKYCDTIDLLKHSKFKLLSIYDILNEQILSEWISLEKDLGIVNQIYLYSISSIGLPVDGKVANLIEMFESLAEIIKFRTQHLKNFKITRNTTLCDCIKAVINLYGTNIFSKEIKKDLGKFSSVLVNTRVNIMHIKLKRRNPYLSGTESCLYIAKISLLYRTIVFDLLGINLQFYKSKVDTIVNDLNNWNNILNIFLTRKIN